MNILELLHSFFSFLGYPSGELFKTVIELVLFTIVLYMIFSEWTRNKRKDLEFLIIAFSVMVLYKLMLVYFLANTVFLGATSYYYYVHTFGNVAEVFALFLLVNAFVYPIIKQKRLKTASFIRNRSMLLVPLAFIFSMVILSIIDLSGGSLDRFWAEAAMNVTVMVILIYYASYLLVNTRQRVKYRANIVAAFVVYAVSPAIELFNILLYDGANRSLFVAASPFPFLSVMLITQVIYLKLVDKAVIIDRLEESERRYKQEKELSKLKDEFISTVSHELRTPLTSMKLYVSLLKDKKLGKISKKQKDALVVVDQEANRLNKLIADILDLSRFEANKIKLSLITFDLYDIVANELYLNMAKEKNIQVVVNVPRKFMIMADKDKMHQVFVNLFTNAIKFTPEGGTITVTAAMHVADWEFSISDTGKGVPKKMLPKLFNKFYQADNFMTRDQGGMGLGLAIVKSIIDLHKGKILVESEEGQGTKIAIRVPRELMY